MGLWDGEGLWGGGVNSRGGGDLCEKSNFCKIQGMLHVDTVDTCMQ